MDIELQVIPDCPHTDAAALLLRRALDDIGLADAGFTVTVLSTDDDAVRLGFPGSPTFIADGADLFPGVSTVGALSCRVYAAGGRRQGTPSLPDLRQALKRAAARSSTA